MPDKSLGYLVKVGSLFIVYFAAAKLGLNLHPVSGFATFVWPPSGIALAAILIFGYRYWPGIMLAAFLINLITGASPLAAVVISIGNTLEPLLGAYLLKRFAQFRFSLERVRDVISLVVFAALISTTVSATIGASSLFFSGTIDASAYGKTWLAWWIGDMLGDLVVAPLILAWTVRRHFRVRAVRVAEVLVLIVLLSGVSAVVFKGFSDIGVKPFTLAYLVFPILIWTALRLGQRGSVAAVFIVSFVAVWGTITSFNVSNNQLSHNLLLLQSFMGITAVTFMIIAAFVSEREVAQKRQLQLVKRTAMLTKQRAHLIALNEAKDEFISLASHQLKTPPSVIKQYAAMLLGNYAGKMTKAQNDMVNRIYDSNDRQIKVIHDLLNVAQLDTGKVVLNKEMIDLVPLITDIIEDKASTLSDRNQKISFGYNGDKFAVSADSIKLGMVLENIIDNASKYSPDGKKIEVNLSKNKKDLAISIKDEGIGISKKDSRKLFKKFSRIHSSSSVAVGGTGLGLYWAEKIINLHGGSITIASKLDKGSTFTINLPNAIESK